MLYYGWNKSDIQLNEILALLKNVAVVSFTVDTSW